MRDTQAKSPWVRSIETDESGGKQTPQPTPSGQATINPQEPKDFLLQEDGFYILLEDNNKILL